MLEGAFRVGCLRGEFLSINLNLKRVNECAWLETRLGIKLESQRDSRRALVRGKIQVRGVPI